MLGNCLRECQGNCLWELAGGNAWRKRSGRKIWGSVRSIVWGRWASECPEKTSGSLCRIRSRCAAATTLVNTQTDSFWPSIPLAQPAELKMDEKYTRKPENRRMEAIRKIHCTRVGEISPVGGWAVYCLQTVHGGKDLCILWDKRVLKSLK